MKLILDVIKLSFVCIKYFFAWIALHCVRKDIIKNEYWLLSEKRTEARDNGYHMFKYLKEEMNIEKAYYAIEGQSCDYKKIQKIGNAVKYNSFQHCLLYLGAKYLLYCQIDSRPYEQYRGIRRLDFFRRKDQVRVYLKHGIAKDDLPNAYDYRKAGYDLFICGAKPEYEYYKNRYNYPDKNIAYTGLSRYDALSNQEEGYTCLIMPTYREWLRTSDSVKTIASAREMDKMRNSKFFNEYMKLLNDKFFIQKSKEMGIKIYFYIHYTLQPYVSLFKEYLKNDNVVICDRDHFDVQELLIKSSILITDYSSVAFDFAYMNKPVAYFQFDVNEYRKSHYKEGYFSYENDGMGPVEDDEKAIVDWIDDVFKATNGAPKITGIYKDRRDSFFVFQDKSNCKRIYDAVKRYEK